MKTRTLTTAVLALGLLAVGLLAPPLVGEAEATAGGNDGVCAWATVNGKKTEICGGVGPSDDTTDQ